MTEATQTVPRWVSDPDFRQDAHELVQNEQLIEAIDRFYRNPSDTDESEGEGYLAFSQRFLGAAYAKQMKVGTWTGYQGRKKHQENLSHAKEFNKRVLVERINSETEGMSQAERKQAAIVAAVDNLNAVTHHATEDYAGTKSGKFINWIRDRSGWVKSVGAGLATTGFGLIAGFGGSMLANDRIRRGYVANNSEDIQTRHREAIGNMERNLSVIEDTSFSGDMVLSAHDSALSESLASEQSRVKAELTPINRGAFIGAIALSAVSLINGGYAAGVESVEGNI